MLKNIRVSLKINLIDFKSLIAEIITDEIAERQDFVSKKLFKEFHVHVDKVLQGKGTSNTGNVAKRLLSKPTLLAQTLELDIELVENLSTILMVFSSKHQINFDKFEPFCESTNALFYRKYNWAKMRPTVHKYLKHGVAICKMFKYPQAYYAEDAGEHMHKLYRSFKLHHARQNSRKNRLVDTFNQAMYESDPLISLLMIDDRQKKKHDPLPHRVQQFLNIRHGSSAAESQSEDNNEVPDRLSELESETEDDTSSSCSEY